MSAENPFEHIASDNMLEPANAEASAEIAKEQLMEMPKSGDVVILTKVALSEGAKSAVAKGERIRGALLGDIQLGKSVRLAEGDTGTTTSHVRGLRAESGKIIIETETSTYELTLD